LRSTLSPYTTLFRSSFGVQAGASYRPFLQAARDPERLAIAEVNPRMPRIDGVPALGGNRVHLSEVDAWVEHETELVTLPEEPPSDRKSTRLNSSHAS